MANWNNPTLTSSYTNFVTEVKDRDVEVALWFEGMSPTNLPTNAKRLNTATGRFEKWNGSAWVDAVSTFTFPALTVAGVSTFSGAATLNGLATFAINPVLSSGAAGGVPYLTVDKQLVSGSALTFDGIGNFTVTGAAGTAGGEVALKLSDSTSGRIVTMLRTGATFDYAGIKGTEAALYTAGNNLNLVADGGAIKFNVGPSGSSFERGRINSTGFGLGTQTPSTIFHAADANPILLIQETDQAANLQRWGLQSESSLFKVRAFNDAMNSAVDLLIGDRSGNLALGFSPSVAYGKEFALSGDVLSGVAAFGVRNLAANNNITYLSNNAKNSGAFSDTYWTSSFAQKIQMDTEGIKFFIAPSGAAGASIGFALALHLDNSLNLISSGTGHWQLPAGTTAQRPAGAAGRIRFNTSLSRYEGHNGSAWSSIGGGATGGGSDDVFYENGQTVTANYTLTTNKNAMSAGPITIASGITVTVPSGANWAIV